MPAPSSGRRDGLLHLLVGRWSLALGLIVLVLGVGAIVGLGQADRVSRVDDALSAGYDSTRAAQIRDTLPDDKGSTALVLFTASDGGALDKTRLAAITEAVRGLDVADVVVPAGPPQGPPLVVPSEDGTAALSILPVDTTDGAAISDAVGALRTALAAAVPDGITAQVTGPAGIQADLAAVFDGADIRLLAVTASVVALLLVLAYRSPVLWIVPLSVVGVADQVAAVAATRVLAALGVPWDESTTGILSVLVFGAGTNYALLLISRYRDELRVHEDRYQAMRVALARAAEAVFASASTVVVGVLCLAVSLTPSTRGLGIASAVGVLVAMSFVLVALPGLLVACGRWVFWPRVPRVGSAVLTEGRTVWRRVGDTVARRPAAFAGGVVVVLAVLAAGLLPTRLGLPTAEQFLQKPEAIAAGQRLAQSFPAGSAQPASVLTRDPRAAAAALDGVPGIGSVTAGATGGGWTELSVVLDADPDSAAARDMVIAARTALSGVGDTYLGGVTAEAVDLDAAAARDRTVVIPLVLVLVLGALIGLLRSLVAPVLLVATVVGTYAAAMGVSWWIFTGLLGFSALDQTVPLYAFLFLVALGVDYNIFLVTRTREEALLHGPREGMLRGLAATGGVITSAGILLAAVFAVLGVLPLVVLAQIGVVICLGVLLDTLVVRTVLVPALALVLGNRFWWPRRPIIPPRHALRPGEYRPART
ncbi:RND superfamily putative drug exporter [Friedmanniella endophytica]|uniref:RND superfamily putative drug exporter n=1 Tax=Microlunatus kandeliicorticis TaxID=1759536 RepID=A0A7W3INU6_9ACTN|nr:MMPL family transporter [Microlunatus kandeliicorticis]MBA8792487.1 RND superfamily putative drug exporter [Microlunatus kandeliicorticis]